MKCLKGRLNVVRNREALLSQNVSSFREGTVTDSLECSTSNSGRDSVRVVGLAWSSLAPPLVQREGHVFPDQGAELTSGPPGNAPIHNRDDLPTVPTTTPTDRLEHNTAKGGQALNLKVGGRLVEQI